MLRKIMLCAFFVVMTIGYGQGSKGSYRTKDRGRFVPKLMSYQGYLTDTLSVPIDDTLDMTFNIYDIVTGGNLWWTETQTNIPIVRGVFSVILGTNNTIPDSVFVDGTDRWLELTLEGPVTLAPRTRMTSAGYAYMATYSDTAEHARNAATDNDWSVTDSVLYTGSFWGLARGGADNAIYSTGNAHTHVNFGRICTTGVSGADFHSMTIGGGSHNCADSNWNTVAGGLANKAVGAYTCISGGAYNEVYGRHGTVGAGYGNVVKSRYGGIFSGLYNEAGDLAVDTGIVITGGVHNDAWADYCFVGGGYRNATNERNSVVCGGDSNTVTGQNGVICGGHQNSVAYKGFIGGGDSNNASSNYTTIAGGEDNIADYEYAFIGAGRSNTASDYASVVTGGWGNYNDGYCSAIGGGRNNYIEGDYSAILGGYADTITSTADYSYLFGIEARCTEDSTFMVDMPHIWFGDEINGYEFPVDDGSVDQVMKTDGLGQLSWTDLEDNDWVISGDDMYSNVSGNIGIGTLTASDHKLNVVGYTGGYAAVRGADQSGASTYAEGQLGVLSVTGMPYNPTNIGVLGIKPNAGADGVAIYGWNNDAGTNNHAVYAVCDGSGTNNYGLYASASNAATNNWAGYFDGDVNIDGDLTISGAAPEDNDWTRGTPDSVLFTSNLVGIARGDASNVFYGDSAYTHINLGVVCTTGTNSALTQHIVISGGYGNRARFNYGTVCGGLSNTALGSFGVIVGGRDNLANVYGFVGGGYENAAGPSAIYYATVAGGYADTVHSHYGSVLGGYSNLAGDEDIDTAVVVVGGWDNAATAKYAFIGGGRANSTSSGYSVLGGGFNNSITASYCGVIVGGADNSVDGGYASVIGGRYNQADGGYSLAAGYHAVANHEGTFVWGDGSSSSDFTTTASNQFLIRATGGVGIGTTSPITEFHVSGQGAIGSAFTPVASNANNVLNLIVGSSSNGALNGISFHENTAGYDMKLGYNGVGSGDANMMEFYDSDDDPILSIQNGGSVMGYGDNGSYNFTFSNLAGYGDNGYIAVLDNSNTIQASMHVNASGDGIISGDVKSFHTDNPSQPGTQIWYTCIEGPEAAAYVRGTGHLVNGRTVIELPQHFIDVASPKGMTVQLTPLSVESKGLAVIKKNLNGIVIRELNSGSGTYEFDFMVVAVRKGYEDYKVIRPNSESQPGISKSTSGSDF